VVNGAGPEVERGGHRVILEETPGRREILDLDVVTTEDGAGWLAFLRGPRARGMKSVELVISDAHPGLEDAIASVLRGATWQRCRTHFIRNLLTHVCRRPPTPSWRPTCGPSSPSPTPSRSGSSSPARMIISREEPEEEPKALKTTPKKHAA
jgi:Transposase, Mutator family